MKKNKKKNDKSEWLESVKRFLKKKYQELLVKYAEEVLESPTCSPFPKKNWRDR